MSDSMNTMNNENGKDSIGKRLKKYRMDHLWTFQQMSNISGISVGALHQIENDEVEPHDLTIARLIKAFPDFENIAV